MSEMWARYEGELVVRCRHENGAEVATFPPGIMGEKELFSPTDLFGASVGMCVVTMMGIRAEKLGIDIKGTKARLVKEMSKVAPFGVKRLEIEVHCPHEFDEGVRERLEGMGRACPLHHSLRSEIEVEITFKWGSDAV